MNPQPPLTEAGRLCQAIALADGFQLLLIECVAVDRRGLLRLIDRVVAAASHLTGAPPLSLFYDPTASAGRGSERERAWAQGLLGPLLALPPPGAPEARLLATVVGIPAAGTDLDLGSWRYLLHRLNEQRNAISRSFAGTLALALPPDLQRLAFEEAPDLASIRSGSFRVDRNLTDPPAPPPPDPGLLRQWYPGPLVDDALARRQRLEAPRELWLGSRAFDLAEFSDPEESAQEPGGSLGFDGEDADADDVIDYGNPSELSSPAPAPDLGGTCGIPTPRRWRPALPRTAASPAAGPASPQGKKKDQAGASAPAHESPQRPPPPPTSTPPAEPPIAQSQPPARDHLVDFLLENLTAEELARFAGHTLSYEVVSALPSVSGDLQAYARALVDLARRHGQLGPTFFHRLANTCPSRQGELHDLAEAHGIALDRVRARAETARHHPETGALHRALVLLSRDQLMQIAALLGDDDPSSSASAWGKRRPLPSARELLRTAEARGPNGLADLAEAIATVTMGAPRD